MITLSTEWPGTLMITLSTEWPANRLMITLSTEWPCISYYRFKIKFKKYVVREN